MSPRSNALQAEIANRRLTERRRRASTARAYADSKPSRLRWIVALAAVVGAAVFFL